jgi:hypothetical protein
MLTARSRSKGQVQIGTFGFGEVTRKQRRRQCCTSVINDEVAPVVLEVRGGDDYVQEVPVKTMVR